MRKEVILANAKAISRRYKRRVWWVSVEDVEQEAVAAQLDALTRFDAEKGAFGAYMWRACVYACHRQIVSDSSPVSSRHDVRNLIGLYRHEFNEEEHEQDQEELLDRAIRSKHVRSRVEAVLGSASRAEFAIQVIGGEFKPAEVAEDNAVSAKRVYSEIRKMKEALMVDSELHQLWSEA